MLCFSFFLQSSLRFRVSVYYEIIPDLFSEMRSCNSELFDNLRELFEDHLFEEKSVDKSFSGLYRLA